MRTLPVSQPPTKRPAEPRVPSRGSSNMGSKGPGSHRSSIATSTSSFGGSVNYLAATSITSSKGQPSSSKPGKVRTGHASQVGSSPSSSRRIEEHSRNTKKHSRYCSLCGLHEAARGRCVTVRASTRTVLAVLWKSDHFWHCVYS